MTKKNVLITGANGGLGKSIFLEFYNNANFFAIGATKSIKGKKIINSFIKKKDEGKAIVLNINKKSNFSKIIDLKNIDILINNASINIDKYFFNINKKDLNYVINTNLVSTFFLTKFIVKYMLKRKWGRIINIGSVSPYIGNIGQSNYSISKLGLLGLTKSLAIELATKNITVNQISPGIINVGMTKKIDKKYINILTNKIPMKRLGNAQDISKFICFLSSEDTNYITGQDFHINGGLYLN